MLEKEIIKTAGETVVDTVIKIALQVMEEEGDIEEDFDLIYEVEEVDNNMVWVTARATVDYKRIPNYIDGYIESYERDYIWEDFNIQILDCANLKQVYKTVRTELYTVADTFTENTRSK